MDQQIRDAIREKKVLEFTYDGGRRTVEPFCYGIGKAGTRLLRVFQTGGYSKSGSPVGWRLFDVAKMGTVTETGEVFSGDRSGYKPDDSVMVQILARI